MGEVAVPGTPWPSPWSPAPPCPPPGVGMGACHVGSDVRCGLVLGCGSLGTPCARSGGGQAPNPLQVA